MGFIQLSGNVHKVQQIGSSLAVFIPKAFADDLQLKKGDSVRFNMESRYGLKVVEISKVDVRFAPL